MTQPTPEDAKAASEKLGDKKPPAKVELLTVGHFQHRDHLLGGVHDRHGVVVETGGVLTVIPLERYTVQVDPAEFSPLAPDDLA